jgi:hypothetical protein
MSKKKLIVVLGYLLSYCQELSALVPFHDGQRVERVEFAGGKERYIDGVCCGSAFIFEDLKGRQLEVSSTMI